MDYQELQYRNVVMARYLKNWLCPKCFFISTSHSSLLKRQEHSAVPEATPWPGHGDWVLVSKATGTVTAMAGCPLA